MKNWYGCDIVSSNGGWQLAVLPIHPTAVSTVSHQVPVVIGVSIVTNIRRSLTEDPNDADDGMTWNNGLAFFQHPEFGYQQARRVGVTHYELLEEQIKKKFPLLKGVNLDTLADYELRWGVRWSGRIWKDGRQLYVAFWDCELRAAVEEWIEVASSHPQCSHLPAPADALFQSTEPGWYDLDAVKALPLIPIPDVKSGEQVLVRELQVELHVASAMRKEQIRRCLRALGRDALDVNTSKRLGGFLTPAEKHYAMGESKTSINWCGREGAGATPNSANIGYRGFTLLLTPAEFRSLVLPGSSGGKNSREWLTDHVRGGGSLGQPMVYVEWVPELGAWKVDGHEGRSRSDVAAALDGQVPIPVHIHPHGSWRARSITPEMRSAPFVREGDDTNTLIHLQRRIQESVSDKAHEYWVNFKDIYGKPPPLSPKEEKHGAEVAKHMELRRMPRQIRGLLRDTFQGVSEFTPEQLKVIRQLDSALLS